MIDKIRMALEAFTDPKTHKPLLTSGLIEGLAFDKNRLSFALNVSVHDIKLYEPLREKIENSLRTTFPQLSIFVALTAHKASHSPSPPLSQSRKEQPQPPLDVKNKVVTPTAAAASAPTASMSFSLPQIRKVLAVASGKGGVGKSMVSLNLALTLQKMGLKVGLLDLDIYGPSLPLMTGLQGPLETTEDAMTGAKKMRPLLFHHMPVMSMGFLVPPASPLIWRGPMIQSGVRQLFMDVLWPDLDVLLLDLPPGTGDTQLTLAQKAPLSGVVIVSTPQDLALADAQKGIAMFQKLNIPIWGLIENMASYVCPHCKEESHPFLTGGAQSQATRLDIPFLGSIPLSAKILQAAELGEPSFLEDIHTPEADTFMKISTSLLKNYLNTF